MKLSRGELLRKFPELKKFENQKWLQEESIKADCNYKEIPLKAAFIMIENAIQFAESGKFSSNWEFSHSLKIRLQQIRDLLKHFCEDTIEEKAVRGDLITHHQEQDPIPLIQERKRVKSARRLLRRL